MIALALEFDKLFGKKLNVTGVIGEVLVCHQRGLKLVADAYANFDAIDAEGKRVQIKSRRSDAADFELPKEGPTISRVSHSFDYLLLAVFNKFERMLLKGEK